jgi:hypothetical protein
MLNQRISADHQIFNVVGVEKFQQLAEVGVDEHRVLSHARRERLIPRRRQSGIGVFDFARISSQRIDPDPQFFLGASLHWVS